MVEKVPHHIECHNQEGRSRNRNVHLFTVLHLTVRLPEQRGSFLWRHKACAKDKTLIQWSVTWEPSPTSA